MEALLAPANEPMTDGSLRMKLLIACAYGDTEVAATLLDANPDLLNHGGAKPMYMALYFGVLGSVQLLSSYSASRTISFLTYSESAEQVATRLGHHDIAAWLHATRNWTRLHHVEFLSEERTRALLRDGGDIHAEVKPFGVTPLSIAQDLAAAARPVINSAFLVLEAAKPWSRKTHHLFPAPSRARAVELWPLGFRLSQQFGFPYEDVWMTFVMPHAVTRDYTPPPPPEPEPPRRSVRIAGRTKTPPPTHAAYKRAARCLAPRHA